MSVRVKLYQRDFSERGFTPEGTFKVDSYSWKAIGGPDKASISVTGDVHQLWLLLDLLRCPVELYNEYELPTWWGYAASVTVRVGGVEIGVSVDSMANSVTVVYAALAGGQQTAGTRATTSAAINSDSVATYGTREMRVSLNDATQSQAEQLRDIVLANRKYPLPLVAATGANAEGSFSATIECRGWWETLSWKAYATAIVKEENTTLGGPKDHIILNLGNSGVAQSFQFASAGDAWAVDSVEVLVGTFTLPLTVKICADSSGAPGTVLASGSLASGGVDLEAGDTTRTRFVMTSSVDLSGANTYWLQFDNGGAQQVNINASISNVYARGVLKGYNGAAWTTAASSPYLDLPFLLGGVVQTSQQVEDMITAGGQFIAAVEVEASSGVWTSPYRNGDRTALAEVEALLKTGVSAVKRLLATVTVDRHVRIYQEPDPTDPTYYMQADGALFDFNRAPLDKALCPVGIYVALKDVIPATVDFSVLASPTPFFVEEASFDARSLTYRPTPRGTPNVFNLGGIKP